METHVNVIAALRIGFSILGLIIGIVLFIILYIVGNVTGDHDARIVLTIIANVLMVIFVLLSIPGIIAGIGLFRRKEWARILTLILSALDLANIPIGTALGAYSIWVLVQPDTIDLFKKKILSRNNFESATAYKCSTTTGLKRIMIEFEITVIGRVQGVGFRYFALNKAKDLGITGWTRNTIDGNVKIVAQSDEPTLKTYVDYLRLGPTLSRVDKITIYRSEITTVFDNFSVKY